MFLVTLPINRTSSARPVPGTGFAKSVDHSHPSTVRFPNASCPASSWYTNRRFSEQPIHPGARSQAVASVVSLAGPMVGVMRGPVVKGVSPSATSGSVQSHVTMVPPALMALRLICYKNEPLSRSCGDLVLTYWSTAGLLTTAANGVLGLALPIALFETRHELAVPFQADSLMMLSSPCQ